MNTYWERAPPPQGQYVKMCSLDIVKDNEDLRVLRLIKPRQDSVNVRRDSLELYQDCSGLC